MEIKYDKNKLACLVSACLATFVTSTYTDHAFAQRVLEEVIITAEKRSANLQDVPVAVSAYTGDELIKLGVSNTQDLQYTTPGLVFHNTGKVAQIHLRGIGSGYASTGLEPSIATYVDDRYVARPSATIYDFADIERVEVLKGPQGTLYGRNATAGAIRVITKGVADESEGALALSAGNYGLTKLSGTYSAPISDTLGYRFTAMVKQRDGFADNQFSGGIDELDDEDVQVYRAKIRWEPSETVDATLSLGYWEREDMRGGDSVVIEPYAFNTAIALGGHTGTDENDKVWTGITDPGGSHESSVGLRVNVAFDTFDFSSMTNYANLITWVNTEVDGTEVTTIDSYANEDEESWSQEFQLVSNTGDTWDWILGTYFYRAEGHVDSVLVLGPNYSFVGATTDQVVETNSWAIYGQSTWHLNEKWDLTLGGRWTDDERDVENRASLRTPITFTTGFSDSGSWSEFTPKVTLEYHPNEDVMYYFTYSRGFKAGGYSLPAASGPELEPEILDMYELGMKGSFLDNQLQLNSALFYYDYTDLQVQRQNPDTNSVLVENAASSKAIGLEADIIWLATDKLTVNAGFNVMDTEYEEFEASATVFTAVLQNDPTLTGTSAVPFDAVGESMLLAPDWSAYLSLEYLFTLGDASVLASITYTYKDSYDFAFIADDSMKGMRQDAYGLLNARVSYEPLADWTISLWGNNLTDEEHWDDARATSRGIIGSPGSPRTFGVDVNYNF